MDEIARKLAKQIDAEIMRTLCPPRWQPQTALRVRGHGFEVVELDDAGNVIEPCRKCGPALLCADCMGCVA